MQTFKRLMTSGKTLQLNHLSPSIRKVFDYAGLSAVLRLS